MYRFFYRLLSVLLLTGSVTATAQQYAVSHGGFFTPKYAKNFTHFSYANPLAPKGETITLTARESGFDTFNPYTLKGTAPDGIELLHATLMKPALNDPNVAYPYVAESLYIANDHTSVVFNLDKNAKFHDGSSITSKDVVFTVDLLKREGSPKYSLMLEDVLSVTRVDKHTVKFSFKNPSKTLPFLLAKLPVLSKDFYRSYPFSEASLLPPVGSGPYEVGSFRPGEFITYKRVREWWGRGLPSNTGLYNFDTVTYRFFKTKDTVLDALARNAIDHHWEWRISRWLHSYNFPAVEKGEVLKKDLKKPYPNGLNALFINARHPHLKDRRIRKALNLLFNFEWLNNRLYYNQYKRNQSIYMDTGFGAEGAPSNAEKVLFSKYDKGLYPPEAACLPFKAPENSPSGVLRIHFEEALSLFQSAGWSIQDGVMQHPALGPFKLRFLFSSPAYEKQYQEYFTTLQRFGIEVISQSVDTTAFMSRVNNFDYDVVLYFVPHISVPGIEQENLWASKAADIKGSLNLSGIKNPMVDDLLKRLINAESLSQMKLYTSLLDRVISWGYYVIPMWTPELIHVAYWNKFDFVPAAENILYPHAWWAKSSCAVLS
jgi:microcin C transport system substrate-binding protein